MQISKFLQVSALALAVSLGLSACNDNNNDAGNSGSNTNAANHHFKRVASFPVCKQLEANCNIDTETAAEIVAASTDGMTLIYSDSPNEALGFVDITDPATPKAAGTLKLAGEPTSVAIKGDYALVGINTSADYVDTSGSLAVVDIASKAVVATINVGGQPDSVAVSPDGNYAAVVIENERNEDFNDGALPQSPAGFLVIVDLQGEPSAWATRTVALTDLADKFPTDPEPEYVDINTNNIAVVTLQENNHIVLVNLSDGSVVNHFSAGTVDLNNIDTQEEDPARITLNASQAGVAREPDGVTWLSTELFATADEGGSRGFTIFNTQGEIVFAPGNALEHQAVRLGHYPDGRSGNKGNEPENAEYGNYAGAEYLFVASERSSLIFVYDLSDKRNPVPKQTLATGSGPEGVLALPARNLLVVASEVDDRGDKLRSSINIYNYAEQAAAYPSLVSADDTNGLPIAWGAMSGLGADPHAENTVYAVEDSFYGQNRIFKLDVGSQPAQISTAITLRDTNNVLANLSVAEGDSADTFDTADLAKLRNADGTVNLDPEGIAVASTGGFWIASEGSGTIGDTTKRPINSLNMLVKTDTAGVIEQVVTLPEAVNTLQVRFGFEGVAEYNGHLYVAFQRAWGDEANPRIGIYNLATATWQFVFYPLDAPSSQNGGWVGLSDITSLGDGTFLVLERDNQGGPDAAIKRLYRIDLNAAAAGATLSKTLVRDLMTDLKASGGLVAEKVEGSARLPNGDVLIINDNDGVDDNSGETQLINLGNILK